MSTAPARRARQRRRPRDHAAGLRGESSFKERFYREARAASRLEHPRSVRVLDDERPVGHGVDAVHFNSALASLRDENEARTALRGSSAAPSGASSGDVGRSPRQARARR